MLITVSSKGSFTKTEKFLAQMSKGDQFRILDKYGAEGVRALEQATPKDTGRTSQMWTYEVVNKRGHHEIIWRNSNVNEGVHIAVIIQYGHATGNGSWIEGRDYINPAIQPIFDKITEEVWREVTNG